MRVSLIEAMCAGALAISAVGLYFSTPAGILPDSPDTVSRCVSAKINQYSKNTGRIASKYTVQQALNECR